MLVMQVLELKDAVKITVLGHQIPDKKILMEMDKVMLVKGI